MKNSITTLMASVAASVVLVLSILSIFLLKLNPLGTGIENYSFDEPLKAYKSELQMDCNADILARKQFHQTIYGRKIKEKIETIKVVKTREWSGKTILFVEYNEAGLRKRKYVGMEKDAKSGYWYKDYISFLEVNNSNPALATEMEEWEKTNNHKKVN